MRQNVEIGVRNDDRNSKLAGIRLTPISNMISYQCIYKLNHALLIAGASSCRLDSRSWRRLLRQEIHVEEEMVAELARLAC